MSRHQSHEDSSEGDYDDDAAAAEAQWQSQQQGLQAPFTNNVAASDQSARTTAPMQKRRRVTRACDECRRKKIKCDGRQPCTHCTVYSYDCTYDQPSNRRRNPAPQYVEALELRLQRAESLLKTLLPDIDLNDPKHDAPQHRKSTVKHEVQPLQSSQSRPWPPLGKVQQGCEGEKDSMLESMVTNTGSLDLDDEGNWDFHGHSSGRVFLRRMRDQFGDLMGKPDGMPFMRFRNMSQPSESPKSSTDTPMDLNLPRTHDLPAKHCAKLLCENALDDAGAIIRVVHQPSFYSMFDRVYDVPYEKYGDEEHRFLPLLYGVIALGSLFARADQSQLQRNGYENAIDQGYHWFKVSRQMIDLTECRDMTSLQTMLYMILFLQSSAQLSTCYTFIGIVLRSSIRMGLHRSVSNVFNPVESELRKRIFWIVRKLDIYVSALLGLPQMLNNDDIDQEMPIEVDDEYITTETVSLMPSGKLSLFTAFNAHTHLVEILAKTVKYIYPIKENEHLRGKKKQSYVVSHAKIREIEQDLQAWMENLPIQFRPGEEASPEFLRIRHLLRMAYAHIQMFLYRPFLHYISQGVQAKHVDKRSYACAAACVSVSRNIVHLTGEMKRRGLLVGSYWFYMYTTFFAIIALIFYILENPQSPKVEDILKEAYEGKDTLAALAAKSMAADRCARTLTELFEQLPSKLQTVRNSTLQKKRQASTQLSGGTPQTLRSAPDLTMKSLLNNDSDDPVRPASSSPMQPGYDHHLVSKDSQSLRHQIIPNKAQNYRRSSQDPYSPSDPTSVDVHTPSTPKSPLPSNGNQPTYSIQNGFVGQGVSDLSAMMFPSSDPFAYPNQPMTTLENHHFIKQEDPLGTGVFNLPGGTSASTPYGDFDTNMYGQVQSFPMPGQQSGYMPGMNSSVAMTTGDPIAPSAAMQDHAARVWSQNQQPRSGHMTGMSHDQLFGEDWGGWMSQYR